ncbi:MAG: carbohydrate kinase family protein [Ignavibacteriales bacterium]|nr:carbohydrate kinase family protein [Ignavibacteriales bacterium]
MLIGHSIIDHFEELNSEISRPGGIFYSTIGILSLAKPEDEIFLLTSMNEKSFHLFESLYSKINKTFIDTVENMPEVILRTSGLGERKETYENLSSQLIIEKIGDWNQFDGILINMITGFDISLDQLKTIRKYFKGIIYFDIHTLSRGVGANMEREFRPIPQTYEWLTNIDILQCNESELNTIVQNMDEFNSAKEILRFGPKILIITKGEKGAQTYFLENGEIKSLFLNAEQVVTVNKIGCGDIFGAVFFYSYISTRDVSKSLNKANKAGAIAATTKNLTTERLIKLND